MTETKNVKISDIKIDGGTQPRESIDESLVAEYAEAMAGGAKFPPVVVFNDGVKHWLADGFHRTHAARRAELSEIAAEVHNGTKRDAILYSVGANAAHGQRRTNADKRKAVMTLLNDEEWAKWSDREIARRCAVSDRFVNGLRPKDTANSSQSGSRTYIHPKTGKPTTMDTAKIGKRPSMPPPPETTEPEAPRPESRGRGLRFAHEAIAVLKKIPHNDGLRQDALDTVSKWIEDNR